MNHVLKAHLHQHDKFGTPVYKTENSAYFQRLKHAKRYQQQNGGYILMIMPNKMWRVDFKKESTP